MKCFSKMSYCTTSKTGVETRGHVTVCELRCNIFVHVKCVRTEEWNKTVDKHKCSTFTDLFRTPQGLRQPAACFKELVEVIDNQLSLLVIPHHGHKHLRKRMMRRIFPD